jgi:hypothetical protein
MKLENNKLYYNYLQRCKHEEITPFLKIMTSYDSADFTEAKIKPDPYRLVPT